MPTDVDSSINKYKPVGYESWQTARLIYLQRHSDKFSSHSREIFACVISSA